MSFTVALVALVLVVSALSTRYYSATITLDIAPNAPKVLDLGEVSAVGAGSKWGRQIDAYYQTQYRVMQSSKVLGAAIEVLQKEHGITEFDDAVDPPGVLRGMVTIVPAHETRLVSLTVEYTDADKAALFANVIGQAYIDTNLDKALLASRNAERWLQEQQRIYRDRKRASDARVISYQHTHGLLTGEDETPATLAQLQVLQDSLSRVKAQRVKLDGQQSRLTKLVNAGDWEALANHLASGDPVMQERLVALNVVRGELDGLRTRYTSAHPKVVEQRAVQAAAIERIRSSLRVESAGRAHALELVREQESSLAVAISQVQEEVGQLGEQLIELRFLRAEADRNEDFFRNLDHRTTEVGLAQVSVANNISVLDPATAKHKPVKPRLLLNALAAAVAGLIGGSGLALGLEMVFVTIRDGQQVQSELQLPFLGFVPKMDAAQIQLINKTTGRETVAFQLPHSPVSEALRSIRTRILLESRNNPVRSLMVTSALPLEGKTFTCTNLASIIAMAGGKVLLVDADLRRPTVHKRFGISNELGLADVLIDGADPLQLVHSTNVPQLDVLVAGMTEHPAEVLERGQLAELLRSLEGHYALVVVDTSPIAVVADGLLWASVTDASLMVIESERTRRSIAQLAGTQLRHASPNVLGVILNKTQRSTPSSKYTYYYRPTETRLSVAEERESA